MVIQTRTSAKKSKASKATSSVSKRNNHRNQNVSASDGKDDASIVSDDCPNNALINARKNEFSERTWWMVDIENSDEEDSSNQGATTLVKRCMRVYGWSLEKSRQVLKAYRQFLILKKEHEDWDATKLSPSFWVDRMWHQHILDVVNYYHDMMLLCGRVVGHNPDGALSGKAERDEATHKALGKRFPKDYDKEIWGVEMNADTSTEAGMRDELIEGNIGREPNNDTTNNVTTNNDTTENDTITIRVKDQNGREKPFSINKTARMTAIFDAYALLKGFLVSGLVFRSYGSDPPFERRSINANDTPDHLGLADNHVIHAFSDARITIRFKDQNGEETMFKVNEMTRMQVIFNAYADRKGVSDTSLRFMLDYERINPECTPTDLQLDDDDQIDVWFAQNGC